MGKRRGWNVTRDREPKVGREVLGWYPKGIGCFAVERSYDGKYYDSTGGAWDAPPLWRKIPAIPGWMLKEAKIDG